MKTYYGNPTMCSKCGKECEKARTQMKWKAVCQRCKNKQGKEYRLAKIINNKV